MYEQLSETSRALFGQAQARAKEFPHVYLGSEHMLLALAQCEEGVIRELFKDFGITAGDVWTAISDSLPRTDGTPAERLPITPRVRFAVEQANDLPSDGESVEPIHLLFGLLQQMDSFAVGYLGPLLEKRGSSLRRFEDRTRTLVRKTQK